MILSDEGLGEFYDIRPIYFWDTGYRNLVPDLRYVGRSASPANELMKLTNWLRDGPSEFLRPAVNPLPAGIETKDLPVIDSNSGVVRINLSAKAASVQSQLARFLTQLKWSLRPRSGTLELLIEGQRTDLGAGLANPAVTPDGQKDPPRFGVVDGRVKHIGGDSVAVPVLNSDDNSGVVSAAVLRGAAQQVALVREAGPGRVRLWLGSYNQAAKTAEYTSTGLTAPLMSRPAGVTTPAANDPAFLVAADGKLFAVSVASKQWTDRTPVGMNGVTAVSVARDGRRVALVVGGRVYVGVLAFDGSSPFVTQLQEVHSGLSDAVGVAWSREGWVVVAGRSAGQTSLVELTIDSALVEQISLRNLQGLAVTRVVADPMVRLDSDPDRGGERGQIMLEANGRAYRVYSTSVDEWPQDPPTGPAPSGAPAKQSPPSAPFFMD
nr:LpqB family beta-propeller domain-containing protein [Planosporangium mesophilum]